MAHIFDSLATEGGYNAICLLLILVALVAGAMGMMEHANELIAFALGGLRVGINLLPKAIAGKPEGK